MAERKIQLPNAILRISAAIIPLLLLIGAGPGLNGSYKVTYAGELSGDGNAAVGANSVTINGKVTDTAGNSGNLIASALPLTDGRFNGTGSFAGQSITVSGRVEAPDGQTLKVARLSCIITLANGKHAKAIGTK